MSVVYKIRRTTDGLFSKGGNRPQFSKNGKVWNTMGHLKSHLTGVQDCGAYGVREKEKRERLAAVYADCEIVEYERVEAETQTIRSFLGL